jgi:hypothetical protein
VVGWAKGEENDRRWPTTKELTPEEDGRLLELIAAGRSWVFISANLRRPLKSVHLARLLETKIAPDSYLPRFLVRQGTVGFMGWNRRIKSPATLYGQLPQD